MKNKKQKICIYAVLFLTLFLMVFNSSSKALGDSDDPPIDVRELQKYSFEKQSEVKQANLSGINIGSLVVYFGSLVFVCFLAVIATRWVVRYTKPSRWRSKYMEMLDVLYLDPKNRIYMVKSPVGIKLLAASEKEIYLIGELDEKTAELIYEAENTSNFENRNFGVQLNQFLKKLKSIHSIKDGDEKL